MKNKFLIISFLIVIFSLFFVQKAKTEPNYSYKIYTPNNFSDISKNVSNEVYEQLCIESKYDGYMKRQFSDIELFKKDENIKIKKDIDYSKVGGLSREVVAKLEKYKPETIGEASRISGITPAAIVAILGYMKSN